MNHITVTAQASATVANQFVFDGGGFPVVVKKVIAGTPSKWETLFDTVQLLLKAGRGSIYIKNIVGEEGVDALPVEWEENTGGFIVRKVIDELAGESFGHFDVDVTIIKGLSLKGTGLGSSGATPAAALRAMEEAYKKITQQELPLDELKRAQLLMAADRGVPDNAIPAYFGSLIQIEVENGQVVGLEKIKKNKNFGLFVVVTPMGFGIKTADARAALKNLTPPAETPFFCQKMKAAMESGDAQSYGRWMEESHEWFVGGKNKTARSRLYPLDGLLYDDVTHAAKKAGATGATISGAGPTLLAIVQNDKIGEVVGKAMHRAFQKRGFDSVARLVDINTTGARIIPENP